jgi:hypothetical protein
MLGNNPDGKVPNARKQAKSKIMRQKSFVSSSFVSPSDIASIRFQQKERTKLHEDVNRGARVTCVRLSKRSVTTLPLKGQEQLRPHFF